MKNEKASLVKRLLSRSKQFLLYLWKQLKDRTNLIIFLIVLAIMYSPTWFIGALGIIFGNAALIAIAVAYAAFWLAPFTPFWGITIGLTFLIRKIVDIVHRRN
jgi:hypothetical protein